jgi:hypothetical protein
LVPTSPPALGRMFPRGFRFDDVEKRWRQLDVSTPRERRCSFRCSTVWVYSSFRRVLLTSLITSLTVGRA